MTRIEDLEIFENSIYEIYYNGKMFNPQLCISHVEKDHEIVNRLKERIEELYKQFMGVTDGLSEEEIYLVEQTLPELQKILEGKI